MGRLTSDKPASEMNMVELAHNCCYADKDMNARYRDFENDIDARELARYLMHMHDAWDSNHEAMVSDEIFDICMHDNLSFEIDDIVGFVARFYQHIWAMADLRERLKYYEDLEEQGLLLKLPCKVGDKVWIIDGQCLSDDECWELNGCENCNLYEAYVTEVTFNVDFYDWMGKTVFLTKEEAEKALAEITEFQKNSEKEVKTEAILAEMEKKDE